MRKVKTADGYYVYNIKKGETTTYLADNNNYGSDINNLLKEIEGIKYDSLIIIFGFDTGEYLEKLYNLLCEKNKVLIFEPNREIYNENSDLIDNDNVKLIFYDKNNVRAILYSVINSINFNNLYVHAFGKYAEVYSSEYAEFVQNLDCAYYTASSAVNVANRFKEIFVKNLIANLKVLKDSTSFNLYENINKGVPAIVVSAGPSLDRNLSEMVKYKENLQKYFIIAGSRTLEAMIKNGIKPDIVVSIDPVDDNYEMMKNYLEEDIPLAFYEYSNRYLIRDYRGRKIYLPAVLSKTVPELYEFKETYLGGSVAHSCIDIANTMGCSPIILVGQDFAFTYDKHHSGLAIFDSDKEKKYEVSFEVDDIHGKKVKTNATLNQFKKKMEEYINFYSNTNNVEFINASYGAEIEGAPHKELGQILKTYNVKNKKTNYIEDKQIVIDEETITYDILGYVEACVAKAKKGKKLCRELLSNKLNKSLMNIDDEDEDLKKFIYIIEFINKFEASPRRFYLGGYFDKFLFDIKEEKFSMYAKDYNSLTSDLKYQSECFLAYFKDMESFLIEIKKLILETLQEFY